MIPDEAEAVGHALRTAGPGDLLVIFGDDITRCWKQIVHFDPVGGGDPAEPSRPTPEPTPAPAFELREGQRLVRDDRGVRLVTDSPDEEAD